jgi:hypothetical protein
MRSEGGLARRSDPAADEVPTTPYGLDLRCAIAGRTDADGAAR